MKAFLQECGVILKGVSLAPFTEFGRDAFDGLVAIFSVLVIMVMSLAILALAPVSIPLIVWANRRSLAASERRRAEFAARMQQALADRGVHLE